MKVIELLGPSGVGKTFLYSRLVDKGIPNRPFLTANEAHINAALNNRFKGILNRNVLYKALLKVPAFKDKRYGVSVKMLNSLEKDFVYQYKFSLSVLSEYLVKVEDRSLAHKRIRAFQKRADNVCLLNNILGQDEVVVLDEGPLHHHHGLTPELLTKYPPDEWKNDTILNPAAVISCELEPDEVFARALQRRRGGINTFSHRSLTETELREYVIRNVEEYKLKIDFLEGIGVPVLRINTGGAIWGNVKDVREFIASIPLNVNRK
ncbi:hypothetical protein [Desertivirga brevis]|uniref:hypothetical protein n=1 Tax=Desertivirga brevis TaxID=2810310 RepID=UPI001A959D69|nr:hypothetical protein [Pedobacter sp. SYSU D00873]